jgi:probable 2-oxoglutarate dehydrogenase E1 component DHKTD1
MGQARAKQYSLIKESGNDCMLGDKVMCVQLHGDAAFTGQGVIMEGLGLSMYILYRILGQHLTWLYRQLAPLHERRKCAPSSQVSYTYHIRNIPLLTLFQ